MLPSSEKLSDFYDERYVKGYMEEWPDDKKGRVFEVIRALDLPARGEALDFGCGNGVFTAILKKALPRWDVVGCDISKVAILNAQKKVPDCGFFLSDAAPLINKKFDFIFSHHVLEHVQDINGIAMQIQERAKETASMLHILPCGNKGSFEHDLCDLRVDEVKKDQEGLFFFEDKGHVRRMTTESCASVFSEFGFILRKQYYSGQYYGAVNWMTRSHPFFIFYLFNPLKGRNLAAGIQLSVLLGKFILMSALRLPFIAYEYFRGKNNFIAALFLVPAMLSRHFDQYVVSLAEREWQERKTDLNGSEMYLYFARSC